MRQYTYTIEVHEGEEGEAGFWVSVPALPGCFTHGTTYEGAVANASEAIQCYLESLLKRGEVVPEDPVHPTTIGIQVALPQMA